jgi:hypothetical protein
MIKMTTVTVPHTCAHHDQPTQQTWTVSKHSSILLHGLLHEHKEGSRNVAQCVCAWQQIRYEKMERETRTDIMEDLSRWKKEMVIPADTSRLVKARMPSSIVLRICGGACWNR